MMVTGIESELTVSSGRWTQQDYGAGVGTTSGGCVHGGLLNGFKGFTPRAQGPGGFGGVDGASGASALRGEGDTWGDVLASAGANSWIVSSLSMRQL